MKLTYPQIILLNHAAWVNRENMDRKSKAREGLENDPVVQQEESKVNRMSPKEMSMYLVAPWE